MCTLFIRWGVCVCILHSNLSLFPISLQPCLFPSFSLFSLYFPYFSSLSFFLFILSLYPLSLYPESLSLLVSSEDEQHVLTFVGAEHLSSSILTESSHMSPCPTTPLSRSPGRGQKPNIFRESTVKIVNILIIQKLRLSVMTQFVGKNCCFA